MHPTDLRTRLAKLNDSRADVFGNIETVLVSTERVTTEHNCTPRDLVAIGDQIPVRVQRPVRAEVRDWDGGCLFGLPVSGS